VCQEIEDEMRDDADADGAAERGLAEALLDTEPRNQTGANGGGDRMRVRHVSKMNVGDASNDGLRGRLFDAQIIEADPGEFHRLHRDEKRRHRR
jgi:hypothetical protein